MKNNRRRLSIGTAGSQLLWQLEGGAEDSQEDYHNDSQTNRLPDIDQKSSYKSRGDRSVKAMSQTMSPHKLRIKRAPGQSPKMKYDQILNKEKSRIQITADWRDECIQKEIEESKRLEKFIEEERARAQVICLNLKFKQDKSEQQTKYAAQEKIRLQEEMIKRHKEKAEQAGSKAVELAQGNMDKYEEKAKLIKEKEVLKEQERLAKIKAKEEETRLRQEEMAKKKEEYERELAERKEQRQKELDEREQQLKEANAAKEASIKEERAVKAAQVKLKLEEGAAKRELTLKQQREAIEEKIVLGEQKQKEKQRLKEIEIEENREKARLKGLELERIKEQAKQMEEERKEALQAQQIATDAKIAQQLLEKQAAIKEKAEISQRAAEIKKAELARKNKEEAAFKKKVIEESILQKDASVKLIKAKQIEEIVVKKLYKQQKRHEKKLVLEVEKGRILRDQMVSLERIAEENVKFVARKKEKSQVQVQIRQMREQLTIKKQKLIDELKEMRKEFHLNNDTESQADKDQYSTLQANNNKRLNATAGLSEFSGSRLRDRSTNYGQTGTQSKFKQGSKMPKLGGHTFNATSGNSGVISDRNSLDEGMSALSNVPTNLRKHVKNQTSSGMLGLGANTRSLDNLKGGPKKLQNIASITQIDDVIKEDDVHHKPKKTHRRGKTMTNNESRNTIGIGAKTSAVSYSARIAKNLESAARLHSETLRAPETQRKVYTEVFSAYLTPNSLNFLQQSGISKATVSKLYRTPVLRKLNQSTLSGADSRLKGRMLRPSSKINQLIQSQKSPKAIIDGSTFSKKKKSSKMRDIGNKSPTNGLDEQDMDVLRNVNPDMLNQTVGMASHEDLDQ